MYLYEKLVSTNTDYVQTYLNLHRLYVKKQAYEKAIACGQKAIDKSPEAYKIQIYIALGNDYLANRDTALAIQQFEKAVEVQPANAHLRNKLVNFLKSIGYTKRADKLLGK